MMYDYFVGVIAENNGFVFESRYFSNDESQTFDYFSNAVEFYKGYPIRLVVLKKWDGDNYAQIKMETH